MAYDGRTGTIPLGLRQNSSSNLSIQEDVEYQHNTAAPIVSPTNSARRRPTAKMPGLLKRAVSSPNVRSLTGTDAMSLSAADKKRNKLGYHRTAVACGHCRRRKIRCIPAFDDTTGRCQNCIRLKKDCHFFPVDQQGSGPGKRARSGSKADGYGNEGETSVSSSSPGVLGSSTMEQIDQVNGQINTPPLPQGSPGFQTFPESGGPVGQHGITHSRDYEYHQGHEHQPHPLSQYSSHSSQGYATERGHFDSHGHHYYHSQEPQLLQSSYPTSPYSSTPLSGTMTMTTTPHENSFHFPQQSPHGDFAWAPQPPVRSMSIADAEDLNYAAYRANSFPVFGRRMNDAPEMPHLPSTNTSMITMAPDGHHLPVTIGPGYHEQAASYHQMHPHAQGNWQPFPGQASQMPIPAVEGYGQPWYQSGSSALAGVREEDGTPSIHQVPPPSLKAYRRKAG